MKIEVANPPNYIEILKVFDVANKPVVFCYGDTIFNPKNLSINQAIVAHEEIHSRRQGDDPEEWWNSYLNERDFRLNEEILAHVTEWRFFKDLKTPRNIRRLYKKGIAERLSSSIYGDLVSYKEALKIIEQDWNKPYTPDYI